jgi:hypothetical protein
MFSLPLDGANVSLCQEILAVAFKPSCRLCTVFLAIRHVTRLLLSSCYKCYVKNSATKREIVCSSYYVRRCYCFTIESVINSILENQTKSSLLIIKSQSRPLETLIDGSEIHRKQISIAVKM